MTDRPEQAAKPHSTDTWPKDCRLLEFPAFADARGTLGFLEAARHAPFEIRRIFYLYDVPADKIRAAHALSKCQQCLIAIAGSFDVRLDDGFTSKTWHLDQPSIGLYVPPVVWRELLNFSRGAVCLVLASEPYDPADYLDTYADFMKAAGGNRK
jgi:hypothetical protein